MNGPPAPLGAVHILRQPGELTIADREGGVQRTLIWADIICEQPLSVVPMREALCKKFLQRTCSKSWTGGFAGGDRGDTKDKGDRGRRRHRGHRIDSRVCRAQFFRYRFLYLGIGSGTYWYQNFPVPVPPPKHRHRRNVMSYRFKSLLKLFSLL